MQWYQINTRRISLQMCLFWNDGLNKKEFDTYGIGIKNQLNYFDGQKTEYWVGKKDWEEYRDGIKRLIRDSKWIEKLPWEAQEFLEKQLARFRKEFPSNLQSLNNNELLALQKKVAEEVGWTNSRTWMVYLSNDIIAEAVREELQKHLKNEEKTSQYILSFSTPLEMNNAMQEHVELLTLAVEQPKIPDGEFEQRLAKHAKKFEYIPMFGFDHMPYTLEHFRETIESFKNPKEELERMQGEIKGRKEKFERELSELNLKEGDTLYKFIQLLKHSVFVRDYRDTLRQQMYLLDRYMYEEIGNRVGGLTAEETTNLTNEEIGDALHGKRVGEVHDIAKKRNTGFLVIQKDFETEVYTGPESKIRALKELGEEKIEKIVELKGTPGSRGRATGPVCIIHTNKDLGKVRDGDVMVTPVTRQDYVPAMRRCAAVINDEGGVTNHAAIVCREFGIPCIVGTKIAVKSFKDGDMVEVDANKGIVKIIKR